MTSGPSPRKIKRLEDDAPARGASDNEDHDGIEEVTRQVMSDIHDCQKELDNFREKASIEILQVEDKYNKLRKPYYDKRAAVIAKIPSFWVNAIVNHPQISMLVDEEEEDCLHFLKKLEVEEFENLINGFRVKFIFDENPFFDNTELVKEFQLGPNTEPKSTSTQIKWKQYMDLSKKQPRIIDARRKRGLEQRTFFSWFSDDKYPTKDDIAEFIKDDLWQSPLEYYLTPDMADGDEERLEEQDMVDEQDHDGNPKDDEGPSPRKIKSVDDDALAPGGSENQDYDGKDEVNRQALPDIDKCQKKLDECQKKVDKCQKKVENCQKKLDECQKELEESQKELKESQKELDVCQKEVNEKASKEIQQVNTKKQKVIETPDQHEGFRTPPGAQDLEEQITLPSPVELVSIQFSPGPRY